MLWHVQTGIKTRTEGKNTPCEILWFLFYPGAGEVITMFSANQRSGEAQPPPQTCALKYTSAIYVWVWYPPAWKCCLAARSGTYGVILKCAPPFEHTSGYFSMTLGCLLMLLDFAVEYVKKWTGSGHDCPSWCCPISQHWSLLHTNFTLVQLS